MSKTKSVVYSRSFADFLKEVDEVLKALDHFRNLTESGKYAFICTVVEEIAQDTGKDWEVVLSEIHEQLCKQ